MIKNNSIAQGLYAEGYVGVANAVPRERYLSHIDKFQDVIDEVGRGNLEKFTRCDATMRRGGKFGFKRKDDGGVTGPESKDTFMFRSRGERFIDRSFMPQILVEFIEDGLGLMSMTSVALRNAVIEMEQDFPGIYALHFGNVKDEDEDMRSLLYDDRESPFEFVSEPHLDISSLSLQAFDGRPGTFYTVNRGGLSFPSTGLDGQSILFPGGWICQAGVLPDSRLEATWHGAVSGQTDSIQRRGVVVQQVQPLLSVDTIAPSFESVHAESSSSIGGMVLEQLAFLSKAL